MPTSQADKLFRFSVCWKITRVDGDILYFTDHDVPLKLADGNLYVPAGGFSASAHQTQQGLKDNNFEVTGMIDSDAIDFEDLRAGKYREAEVIESVVDWSNPTGAPTVVHRYWISQTQFNGQSWVGQLVGQSMWINRPVGRTYLRECDANVGDSRCTVDLSGWTVTGTVTEVQLQRKSFVSDITSADSFPNSQPIADKVFNDSNITWLTGANSTFPNTQVKRYLADGSFSLQLFSVKDIQVGDTFSVYRTCDKSFPTCSSVFANTVNYRGFPYIPGTDLVLSTPRI